jgi:hypothetical protein
MKRGVVLGFGALFVFVVFAAGLLRVMPQPMKDSDYLVVGSVATIAALGTLFVVLGTASKGSGLFFKKRKKR